MIIGKIPTMRYPLIISLLFVLSCKNKQEVVSTPWVAYDQSSEIATSADHENPRMQFKLIQSKVLDKGSIWENINQQIEGFDKVEYQNLKPLILERDILSIQGNIDAGKLSYQKLTQWYLYRILKYESDNDKSLQSIISINPNAVAQAIEKDTKKTKGHHPIYGMPILLKDNINTEDMPTTAGAIILQNNQTTDAEIVKNIKGHGGIILGKVNLSEWAYYFCTGCPLGYSAVGGQTLNPYGRKIFETGGSSAGSGTTMAANYAAAAVGTETSGSILSPSSQNSVVGLKPTIGLLSGSGIVPISSTLDTPGPMTRNVSDNAILLSAMSEGPKANPNTKDIRRYDVYHNNLNKDYISGLRLGVIKNYLEDSLYTFAINDLKDKGAEIIEIEPENISFDKFITFLNADMQRDFPKYMKAHAGPKNKIRTVKDVVEYNLKDTLIRAPYGQKLFEGVVAEDISDADFDVLKSEYDSLGKSFFNTPMDKYNLDAIVSINNYNAGHAAMAKYPCMTVPMGYQNNGEPKNITFIAKTLQEDKLLKIAYAYEQATKKRKMPSDYK